MNTLQRDDVDAQKNTTWDHNRKTQELRAKAIEAIGEKRKCKGQGNIDTGSVVVKFFWEKLN